MGAKVDEIVTFTETRNRQWPEAEVDKFIDT